MIHLYDPNTGVILVGPIKERHLETVIRIGKTVTDGLKRQLGGLTEEDVLLVLVGRDIYFLVHNKTDQKIHDCRVVDAFPAYEGGGHVSHSFSKGVSATGMSLSFTLKEGASLAALLSIADKLQHDFGDEWYAGMVNFLMGPFRLCVTASTDAIDGVEGYEEVAVLWEWLH